MKRLLVVALVLIVGVSLLGVAAGKVAIVLDVGGRGDLSFNDMGFKGTDQAARDFGLEMTEVQSATGADYLPNIRNLARTGEYDLILCVGFLLGDALNQAAQEFPNQRFAIIDSVVAQPNVMSIVFRENEMSALIGALAAMAAAYYGYPAVGMVLGIEIPVLWHFEAGFRYGMYWGLQVYAIHEGRAADVRLLYTYTGTFSDIALGQAASEAMLAQGAVGIYNVAGPLGVGDLEAITEFHVNAGTTYGPPYYFGVDADQDWMGMGLHGIASGMKRVDNACYMAVQSIVEGTFRGGTVSLGLKEGGVAISAARDLLEFMQFGIGAGQLRESDSPNVIYNWEQNRATVPEWIWSAVDQLGGEILGGWGPVPLPDVPVPPPAPSPVPVPTPSPPTAPGIPSADTGDEIATVRARYTLSAP